MRKKECERERKKGRLKKKEEVQATVGDDDDGERSSTRPTQEKRDYVRRTTELIVC